MALDPDACYRAIQVRDARVDGRFFVAVKTTGIYCRPVCPARTPKRENVLFLPNAASAQEAGYRACLRCRPETSPQLGAWNGASNTVSRALRLIEAGALDEDSVEILAERLGVGGRQLRRLFVEHLGATPVGVAQTRRVLLAKQLIHETNLPMNEVALAAGFGSVRRFNEIFQRLYDRPPAALRRHDRAEAAPGEAMVLTLRYRPPYDWEAMLAFLRPRALPGVEVVENGVYRRTIALEGAAGTISVRPISNDRLSLAIRFPKTSTLPKILARVRDMFDLSADPASIAEGLSRDPDLARRVALRPGLRIPGAWDGFELAVRAMLERRTTVATARAVAGQMVISHGQPLPSSLSEQGLTHLFPTAQALSAADLSDLNSGGADMLDLSGLAAAIVTDPQALNANLGLGEIETRLRALPGVDEWMAHYIAMRHGREPDAFPAGDLDIMWPLAGPDDPRPTASQVLARSQAWRPWRAYAALHLWMSPPAAGDAPLWQVGREL